jgi:hypothetical protein
MILSLETKNKLVFIWYFARLFVSLQRQNVCFDYAAECGEQGFIDTAPFKATWVAFFFHISF